MILQADSHDVSLVKNIIVIISIVTNIGHTCFCALSRGKKQYVGQPETIGNNSSAFLCLALLIHALCKHASLLSGMCHMSSLSPDSTDTMIYWVSSLNVLETS